MAKERVGDCMSTHGFVGLERVQELEGAGVGEA